VYSGITPFASGGKPMAFTDPQSVTINSVAQSMPRIQTLENGQKTIYQKADGTWKLTVSHKVSGKDRVNSMVRLDQVAIVPDPLTTVNDFETLSFWMVFDRPLAGFTQTQCEQIAAGLKTWLDNTAIGRLFGRES
jgi:hypothetical protein